MKKEYEVKLNDIITNYELTMSKAPVWQEVDLDKINELLKNLAFLIYDVGCEQDRNKVRMDAYRSGTIIKEKELDGKKAITMIEAGLDKEQEDERIENKLLGHFLLLCRNYKDIIERDYYRIKDTFKSL